MTPPAGEGWRHLAGPGFPAGFGPLWARRHGEGWEYGLVPTRDHADATGRVQAGVLLALADHALSLIAWEAAYRTPCVTIQLGMQCFRAVGPGVLLRARGRVERLTRSLVFLHAELDAGNAEPVAAADGVWRVLGGRVTAATPSAGPGCG